MPFAKVEDDAQIILPAAANFLDTQTDVNYDQAGGSILGNAGVFLWWPPGGNCECSDDRSKKWRSTRLEKKSGTIQKSDSAKENDTSVAADSSDKTKSIQ